MFIELHFFDDISRELISISKISLLKFIILSNSKWSKIGIFIWYTFRRMKRRYVLIIVIRNVSIVLCSISSIVVISRFLNSIADMVFLLFPKQI